MANLIFRNNRTNKVFKIVAIDKAAGTVTLQGEHALPFVETYDKERFQNLGYVLEKENVSGQE